MSTPTGPAPATVGNQPTEAVSMVHRVLTDLRTAVAGLNGEIQQELLRLHDEMRAAMDRLFGHAAPAGTSTVLLPPTPQVAEPGSEAHTEGLAQAAEATAAAEQERQAELQRQQEQQIQQANEATPETASPSLADRPANPATQAQPVAEAEPEANHQP